ncbi:thiamine phosphate synthase [Breoghania sp. L-A4]|uniref:thiamine phosphate synthase n=1 Tax=Breoghania sp. L-A4 TaxID=2304600 RepID=UPI0019677EE2|nr:thiamine phosphate synthase [Breoghania sp. L-A4]
MFRSRLFLITPTVFDVETFAPQLREALAGGDVASLLIAFDGADTEKMQTVAEVLTPIAQDADVAVLIRNDTQAAGRSRADGVHVDTDVDDLLLALESMRPNRIVGAGGIKDRHTAMMIGSTDADYIFFGMLDLEERDEAHPKNLDFGEWWAEVFEVPCVVMAGRDPASVHDIAMTRADFVALRAGVWEHPEGPRKAVADANAALDAAAADLKALEDNAG